MTLDPFAITDFLARAGVLGLMVIILVTGVRGDWVFGHHYRELQKRNERLEVMVEKLTVAANRSVRTTENLLRRQVEHEDTAP